MSFVSDVVGSVLGGAKSAPQINLGSIQNPTSPEQVQQAQQQVANAYAQQLAFVQALQGNQGLSAQNQLLAQLQQQAQGQGPNPAAAQLAQATAANTANQAALMAGQRGASANAGLVGRQIAQQGAANQQNMVGQAATMQANQQLAAQQQLAALSGQQVGQQQAAIGQLGQIGLGQQGNLLGAQSNFNQAQMSGQQANLQAQLQGRQQQNQMVGGLIGAAAPIIGGMFAGPVGAAAGSAIGQITAGGAADTVGGNSPFMLANQGAKVPGQAPVPGDSPKNDIVPAMLSPGELVIPRSVLQSENPEQAIIEFYKQHKNKPEMKQGYFDGGTLPEPDTSPMTVFGFPLQSPNQMVSNPNGTVNVGGFTMDPSLMPSPKPAVESPSNLYGFRPEGQEPEKAPAEQFSNVQLPQPKQPQQQQPDYMQQPAMPESYKMQKAGIDLAAKTEAAQGKKEASLLQDQASKQQAIMDKYNAEYQKDIQNFQAESEKFRNDPVDAQRFINSMSGGQKAMSAIGLILGGIGQGLAGGENVALKMLQKQIDADIDSQFKNKDIQSKYIQNLQQTMADKKDAMITAKALYADILNNKMQQLAAESKDPMAKARALQIGGQLMQPYEQMAQMNAQRKTVISAVDQGLMPAESGVQALASKEDKPQVHKELEQYTVAKKTVDTLKKNMAEVQKLLKTPDAYIPESQTRKQINTLQNEVYSIGKVIFGNFTGGERDLVEDFRLGLWDRSPKTIQNKVDFLVNSIANKVPTATLNYYLPGKFDLKSSGPEIRQTQAPGSYNARSNK